MPTATSTHTTPTRRSALRFSVAAITAGLTASALAAAPGADADLLALCAEAARCEARIRHVDKHGTSDEECTQASNAWDETFTRLVDMPALTLAGVQAKASALQLATIRENMWSHSCETITEATGFVRGAIDGRLAYSLCRDILALTGAA
jgi:hypothetical protein